MQTIKNPIEIKPEINPEIYQRFQKISEDRSKEKVRPVSILEAKNVVKKYNDQVVIPDLNFQIQDIEGKAEIISIIGPSGCGKSTILKMIAGLEHPTQGEMLSLGKRIEGPSLQRGMIFQKYSSFSFLNVIDNIAYPLIQIKKIKPSIAQEQAKVWVDRMYLKGAEKKYPYQLSGGMQQRVAIARTLCMDAQVILMDEPFGALDRKIRWEMQDLIAELMFLKPAAEYTVLIVTHDIPEAVYLGDRIWVMHKGKIISEDHCERPSEPARVAQGRKPFQEMVSYFNEKIDHLDLVQK